MNSPTASVQHMGVNHRRANVSVAQQLLDRQNIIPILQQVGGKGVAKRMAACRFGDLCFQSGFLEGSLQDRLVQVVPALFAGNSVSIVVGGGKDPLPGPLLPGVGILPLKGIGQGDAAQTSPEILLMLAFDRLGGRNGDILNFRRR